MKKIIRKITQALIIGTLIFGTASITGCKKKKELAAAQAAEAAELAKQVKEATATLQAILADNTLDNIDANYQKLNTVKAMKLQDAGVNDLINQVDAKLLNDSEALRKQSEAERAQQAADMKLANDKSTLNQHFQALANESDYGKASNIMNNTLPLFENENVPVLIIISEENGEKDYDKPTTIKKYMQYLTDRQAYNAEVDTIEYDDNGKIKELELRNK
jgi:hypothetical protein